MLLIQVEEFPFLFLFFVPVKDSIFLYLLYIQELFERFCSSCMKKREK